ncbi:MAG: DinB family protein [Rhodothermales bacterium]
MSDAAQAFLDESRRLLRSDYLPKIERCLEALTEEDVWWRPNEESNSIGNLLLHLAGNVRQWIVSGVGGADDVRRRQQEFDERAPVPVEALRAQLRATLEEADAVLARLDPAGLLEARHIQGGVVSVFGAIYHVVEHFGMHTGQIIYVTKMRQGADMGFYDLSDGTVRTRWHTPRRSE